MTTSSKTKRRVLQIITMLTAPLLLSGCRAKPDPAVVFPPENLKYYYHDDDREIKVIWDTVEDCSGYEIKYCDANEENWRSEKTTENIYYIKDVDQGDSGKIFVRALGSDGGCSQWSQVDYEIEVYITAPKTIMSQIDGKYNYVIWEPVDGASRYEVKCFDDDGNETEVMKIEAPANYFRVDRRNGGSHKYDIRTLADVGGTEYSSEWKSLTVFTPSKGNTESGTCFETGLFDLDSLREYARRHLYTFTTSKDGDKTIAEVRFRDIEIQEPWILLHRTNEGIISWQPEVSAAAEEYFSALDKEAGRIAHYNAGRPDLNRSTGGGMDAARFESYVVCYYVYSDTELAPDHVRIAMLKCYHEDFQTRLEQEFGQPANGYYWMKLRDVEQKFMMSLGSNDNYWLIDIFPSHAK